MNWKKKNSRKAQYRMNNYKNSQFDKIKNIKYTKKDVIKYERK